MKIANKISFSFFIIAIIFTSIVAPISYLIAKNSLKDSIYSHLVTTVYARGHHIETYLAEQKGRIELLSKLRIIENILSEGQNVESLNKTLRKIKESIEHEHIYELFVVNTKGIVVASADKNYVGKDKSKYIDFVRVQKGSYIKDAYLSADSGRAGIDVVVPIREAKTKRLLGVLISEVGITSLNKITTERKGLGKTGEIYLINKDSYMITESRFIDDTFLKIKVDTENARNCFEPEKEEDHGHVHGIGDITVSPDYRGVTVLGTHYYIEEMGWGLLAEIDEKEALAPLAKLKFIFVAIILLVPAISWLIGSFITKKITVPIRKLHEGAETVSRGNLDYKIGTDAKDEIGQLSRAFDKMTKDLRESTTSIDELNKEVTERKKAEEKLEESHKLLEKQAIDLEVSLKEALKARETLTSMLDDNNQVRENLEKSKGNLDEAQRIAHVGNWDLDLVTNELKWSDEIYRIFGLKHQEYGATYETFLNAVHPDDREFVDTSYENSMKTGKPYDIVYRIIRPDGEVRYVNEIVEGVKDETGKRIRAIGTVQDITESKKKEEEIKTHVEHLNALRSIDMAITGSLDLRVTFDVFLEHVIKQLSVDAADIMLLNPHAQRLEYAFSRGFRTRAIKHASTKVGEGYAGRIALERKPLIIPDIPKTSDKFRHSHLITDEEFKAYVGTPLIAKGLVKGVLEIFHRSHFDPDEEWLEFFEALATQAAIAIDNATLFNDLQRSHDEIVLAYDTTIEGWSKALDYRDKETEGHSQRVAERTVTMARKMGIDGEKLIHVRRGALLHDIGKLGIPDKILFKAGKLTNKEFDIMKRHPVIAYDLLSPIHYLRPAILIPYCHHEKWDGTGYPRRLKGETIPIEARIFAIIDIWDALTSDRPYRPAWSKKKARSHIRSEVGKHFDPEVAEVFLKTKL